MAADASSTEARASARAGASQAADAGPAKRIRTVAVRLSEAEEAAWIAAALADGYRQLGAWVRERAVAGYLGKVRPRQSAVSSEAAQEIAALRQEMARWGNNLNQIARAINSGQVPANIEQHLRQHWPQYGQTLARMADRLDALEG
ncbi:MULTISPECIES: plasmid mobilization relaxosome protein MobC [unclassified Rhodococcus (in: high G+C Gram-positive bacteria)]|uniref:plasmid mobilization relaxosome protein MobC n=1 Tax=unclassified Rhodococcus (in: high G+C Gram-positive bacteria) TaxID=192944 RepID=UPI000DB1374B|nr:MULTISPECIES: plasmid mobilization relaxosome protein MobC [unclassified Rhodococcus (in: high G+C Gram-positive bacteria)]MBX4171923.1 MobC family plasmid mobilization relaxosome protein [Rhodococcus sp. DMU2021]PZN21820.1 MAG: hypothetical protein DIU75_09235 [Mycolicibacterium hassiacum]BDB63557.1 hypothetical protein RDE2_53510 [Rhodococcus sp. RDE2]